MCGAVRLSMVPLFCSRCRSCAPSRALVIRFVGSSGIADAVTPIVVADSSPAQMPDCDVAIASVTVSVMAHKRPGPAARAFLFVGLEQRCVRPVAGSVERS